MKKHFPFFIIIVLTVFFAYPHQQGVSPFDPGDYCKCAVQLLRGQFDVNSVYCNRFGSYLPVSLAILLFGFNGYYLTWVTVAELVVLLAVIYLALVKYSRGIALISIALIGFAPLMLVYSGHLFGDIMVVLTSNACILWIWHYYFFTENKKQVFAGVMLALLWYAALLTKESVFYYLVPILIFFIRDKRKNLNTAFWNASILTGIALTLLMMLAYMYLVSHFYFRLKLLEIGPNSPIVSKTYYFSELGVVLARVTVLPAKFLIEHFSYFIIFLPSLLQFFTRAENDKERFLRIYGASLLVLWWAGTSSFKGWKPVLLEDRLWLPLVVPLAINAAHVFYFIARGNAQRYANRGVKIILAAFAIFLPVAASLTEENLFGMTMPLRDLLLRMGVVMLLFIAIFRTNAVPAFIDRTAGLVMPITGIVSRLFRPAKQANVHFMPPVKYGLELFRKYYVIILLLLLPLFFNTRTTVRKNPRDNDYLADKEMIDTVRRTMRPATILADNCVYRNHGIYYGFAPEVDHLIRFADWNWWDLSHAEAVARKQDVYLLVTHSRIEWYHHYLHPEMRFMGISLPPLPHYVLNPLPHWEPVKQNSRAALYKFKGRSP